MGGEPRVNGAVGSGVGQWTQDGSQSAALLIFKSGRAFCSTLIPASVTFVLDRSSVWSCFILFRWARPASPTFVAFRDSDSSLFNPLTWTNPASVILVAFRDNCSSRASSLRLGRPASVIFVL